METAKNESLSRSDQPVSSSSNDAYVQLSLSRLYRYVTLIGFGLLIIGILTQFFGSELVIANNILISMGLLTFILGPLLGIAWAFYYFWRSREFLVASACLVILTLVVVAIGMEYFISQ